MGREREGGGGSAVKQEGRAGSRDGAPLYACGEGVLGWHVSGKGARPVLYKARVLRRERRGGAWWYALKYQGFPSRWNTWNREAAVAADTSGNRKTMEGILGSLRSEGGQGGGGGSPAKASRGEAKDKGQGPSQGLGEAPRVGASGALPAKRRFEATTLGVDDVHELGCPELWGHIRRVLPRRLRAQLHEDWQQVCREGRLMVLPRKPSAADVLREYVEAKRDGGGHKADDAQGGGPRAGPRGGGGSRERRGGSRGGPLTSAWPRTWPGAWAST